MNSKYQDIGKLLDGLKDLFTDDEREQIELAFNLMKSSGKTKAKLVRPVIPIKEWVNSPYYIGPDVDNIYPFWKEHLSNIYESEHKINQVILTGAIGCLKTDTLYSTSEGFKTLKELSSSFEVISEGKKEIALTSKHSVLGVTPTKRIILSNGTVLEGTTNHKIKIIKDNKIQWQRFDKLELGDSILHTRNKELFGKHSIPQKTAYNIGYKLVDKALPKFILSCDDTTIAAALQGIFDSSGNINDIITLTVTSKKLSKQVKRILAAFGIDSKLTEIRSTCNKDISSDIYKIVINDKESLELFQKYINFSIDSKKEKLKQLVDFYSKQKLHTQKEPDLLQEEDLKYFIDNNCYTNRVINIIDSKAETGDIEVPVNRCYNLGGIISHNTGKSTMAVLIIIRKIYELSCYENISALFNLFGVSRIAFAYLSVTREQAQNTGFALLTEWIDSIPYFKEKFKRRDKLDSMLIWPQERLIVTYGSVANHFIGMNLIGSVLDEANFFAGRQTEEANYSMNTKVASLYTQIITRSQSRFIINGINESLSLLVSSSTVKSSFTNETISKSKGDKHTYIVSPSIWDVKPQNYKGEKFLVFTGISEIDPHIINSVEDLNSILAIKQYTKRLDTHISLIDAYSLLPIEIQSNIIRVPVEHKQAFTADITIALQDLAGYSVSSVNKLFNSNTAYEQCINSNIVHPFSKEQIVISTTKVPTQEGFLPIKSYLLSDIKFSDKHMPRYMHLDLALTGDSIGISMCYISGWKNIYKQDAIFEELDDTGDYLVDDEIKIPILTYDFMLRINPPKKPNKIALSKIRDFIVYLRKEHGIKFGLITADQFQSAQMLQELQELGFDTGYLSVDRTADAYLLFTNLIYEERTNFYDYEPFKTELFNLVYYPAKKKVDHLSTGSKDVADSVVGSAFNAIKALDKTDVREQALADLFINANVSTTQVDAINEALSNLFNALTK